jgi:hypothetical protein
MARLKLSIVLESGTRIGPGKTSLLESIRDTGSISAAARNMGRAATGFPAVAAGCCARGADRNAAWDPAAASPGPALYPRGGAGDRRGQVDPDLTASGYSVFLQAKRNILWVAKGNPFGAPGLAAHHIRAAMLCSSSPTAFA